MKQFKFIAVIAFMLIYYGNASAQISRKEMISYYKWVFMVTCTAPFEIDTGFREEVCSLYMDELDRKSYLEIDSMSALSAVNILLHVKMINESSDGSSYPASECVLRFCLDQYDSKDMDKMAKGFARRMKKVNPMDYHKY